MSIGEEREGEGKREGGEKGNEGRERERTVGYRVVGGGGGRGNREGEGRGTDTQTKNRVI